MATMSNRVGPWLVATGMAALAIALYVHEQREAKRLSELVKRVDELRVLQSSSCEKSDFHLNLPSADALADAVATRLATRQGVSSARPPDPVGDTPPARPEDPAEEPPRTLEQQRLLTQATRVADAAIRSRRLSRSDVEELRSLFGRIGPGPEQLDLRDRIIKAINDQALTVEDPAFILF